MHAPSPSEYTPYFQRYVTLVPDGQLMPTLRSQVAEFEALFATVTEAQGMASYAPGKWSLKEVIGHVADTERVFGFRALHIARGDANPLPSFDQDQWTPHGQFNAHSVASVLGQWRTARLANITAIEAMPDEAINRSGIVSGNPVTVRALVHILAGHVAFHITHVRENYLT
ncbi:MAG: DinB family protein [Gemmatimonadaceae bacterium]|nr:DinB family protein [Gemmatimonadaceae bacterium]